jgi:hypothetical protein
LSASISTKHESHHVAQRLITAGWPWVTDARSVARPSSIWSGVEGREAGAAGDTAGGEQPPNAAAKIKSDIRWRM